MPRRRLLPLALVITALLAVVAVAAHGRPLGSGAGRSSGLPSTFWDYVFTSVVILIVLSALASLVLMFVFRRERNDRQPSVLRTVRSLAILLAVALLVFVIGRHINLEHLLHPHRHAALHGGGAGRVKGLHGHPQAPRARQFRWQEALLVAFLLVLIGAAVALRRPAAAARPQHVPEELVAALDDSLDDLRCDPDLRRAIVAAYARMEIALDAAGLPRKPAEAPLEYLERALLALELSEGPVRRLTDLFEWARFSHHEPEPAMRDEAVDALVAVRDELRTPTPMAA